MMNRINNMANPYQGSATRILCVCSAGLLRSPTLAEQCIKRGHNARAVGYSKEYALIQLDWAHIYWADLVLCVDSEVDYFVKSYIKQSEYLEESCCDKIKALSIPDIYPFRDEELVKTICSELDEIGV